MWEYTEKVMEHYKNPKNVGEIENASAIGEAGSLVCGDALKLYLKIDDNGIITDAKFQTFGCGSAVASSSILTEMLKGKTIEDAEKITNQDIADALGGLPPEKMHCSVMGHEALESAIANYKGIEVSSHCEEKVICSCYHITEKYRRHLNCIACTLLTSPMWLYEEIINPVSSFARLSHSVSCQSVLQDPVSMYLLPTSA
jgi:NifU-like protein